MTSKSNLILHGRRGARKCKVAHLPFGKIRGRPPPRAIPIAFARHQGRIKPRFGPKARLCREQAETTPRPKTGVSFHPRLLAENIERGNPEVPYSPSIGFALTSRRLP